MLLLQLLQYVKVGGSCIDGAEAVAAEAACDHLTHPSSFLHQNFKTSNRAHSTAHPKPAHTMMGVGFSFVTSHNKLAPPDPGGKELPRRRRSPPTQEGRVPLADLAFALAWLSLELVLPWRPIPQACPWDSLSASSLTG